MNIDSLASIAVVCSAAVLLSLVIAIAGVRIARTNARERTRRELFAYVAESSLTMEQAERLIALCEHSDLRREILATANHDWDWDRWRETVRNVVDSKPPPAPVQPAP